MKMKKERTIQNLFDSMFDFWEKYLDINNGKVVRPRSGRIFDISFQKDGYDFSEYSFYVSHINDFKKRKQYILFEKIYDNEFMNESLGTEILYEIINFGENLRLIAAEINKQLK